jgi:hypothetical protein
MTLIERFDPARALAVIERDGVTVFQGARLSRDPGRRLYS